MLSYDGKMLEGELRKESGDPSRGRWAQSFLPPLPQARSISA